ncbi:MAG: TolB family protein [Bacteroidota bacterium]
MRTVLSPLLRKEFRQNLLVYLTPLPILFLVLFLRARGDFADPESWLYTVFTLAVPLTLAVAFGLQAFDIEVNAQTRDFLLVKPLSTGRIVREKFGLGWLILIFWTAAFNLAVDPTYLSWAAPMPVSTWLGAIIFCWATLVYGASYLVGLLVPGPKKMLLASLVGAAAVAWHFLTWSSWTTFLVHRSFFISRSAMLTMLFYALGMAAFAAIMGLLLTLTAWFLRGRPALGRNRVFRFSLLTAFFLLLTGLVADFGFPAPIRAADFLGLELFDLEQPFWTNAGAWRPDGKMLAVAGPDGALGLAAPGGKPRLIYKGQAAEGLTIEDLSWSPDGKKLAFSYDGAVYVLRLGEEQPVLLGQGSSPCWARTSDAVLYTEASSPWRERRNGATITLYRLNLRKADLASGRSAPFAQLVVQGTTWYWDSATNDFMFVDIFGQVHVLRGGADQPVPLPGLHGSVSWHRFHPLPGKDDRYLIAVISLIGLDREEYDVHCYEFDARTLRVDYLRKLPGQRLTNLILDPATGSCLIGHNGVYRRVDLRGGKGGRK